MDHTGQLFCIKMEMTSFALRVLTGCDYNKCRFCCMFKNTPCKVIPLEEVEADIIRVAESGGQPRKILLCDGDPMALSTGHLLTILGYVKKYLPDCREVNTESTVQAVLRKTDEELASLYEAGLRHVYLGVESVLDDVLEFMQKGHDTKESYEAAAKLKKAGLFFDMHVISGIAGEGRGQESALAMAKFINETRPRHVLDFTLYFTSWAPLYEDTYKGRFIQPTEQENMKEMRTLIANIDEEAQKDLWFFGIDNYLHFRVNGILSDSREKMLEKVDRFIKNSEDFRPIYACPELVEGYEDEDEFGGNMQKYAALFA